MDPLSATVTAGSILHAVLAVSKVLHDVLSKDGNQVIKDLTTEVDSLVRILKTVQAELDEPSIIRAEEQFEATSEEKVHGEDLWSSVQDTLKDCEQTVERMHKGIQGLTTRDPNAITQQILSKIKLNFKESEIAGYRAQIHSHITALSLGLQTIHLRALMLVPGQVLKVGGDIEKKMVEEVRNLQISLDAFQKSSPRVTFDDETDPSATLVPSEYRIGLQRSAERIISSASTTYAKSEGAQSVAGVDDPIARARTRDWISKTPDVPDRNTSLRTSDAMSTNNEPQNIPSFFDDPLKSPTTNATTREIDVKELQYHQNVENKRYPAVGALMAESDSSNSYNISTSNDNTDKRHSSHSTKNNRIFVNEVAEDSDSEHDFELEEASALLAKGVELYHCGQYEEANHLLREGTKQATKLSITRQRKMELGERRLMLAMCAYYAGDLDETEKHLIAVIEDPSMKLEDDQTNEEAIRQCQSCHLLASVYLRQEKYNEARENCRKATKGLRKLLGKDDSSYYESLCLLSFIDNAAGLPESIARTHLDMIPNDQQQSISQNVKQTLDGKVRHRTLFNYEIFKSGHEIAGDEHLEIRPQDEIPSPDHRSSRPERVDSAHSEKSEGRSIPFQQESPRSSAYQRDSLKSNEITTFSSHEQVNLSILKDFVAFLPKEARQSTGVPVEKLDPAATGVLLPWFQKFSTHITPYTTPLHVAAAVGHVECALILMENELDPNERTAHNHQSTMRIMHYAQATPLHFAATYGRAEMARVLLDNGAELEAQDSRGHTPLHYAARTGVSALLEVLQEHGANVQAKNVNGTTPLHMAAIDGHSRFCKYILNEDIDIDAQNSSQKSTAAHFAAAEGQVHILQLLIDNGADLEKRDVRDQTPLHRAVAKGHIDVVQKLLDKEVDIHAKADYNRTPLHTAAWEGRKEIAGLLLEKGARLDARDIDYKRPRDLARERLHSQTADYLKHWKRKKHTDSPTPERQKSWWGKKLSGGSESSPSIRKTPTDGTSSTSGYFG